MKKRFFLLGIAMLAFSCSTKPVEKNDYSTRYLPVEQDDGVVFYDTELKQKISASKVYDDASYFFDGVALVEKDGEYFYVNEKLEPINNVKYASATVFHDGYAIAAKEGEDAVILDKNGYVVATVKDLKIAGAFNYGISACMLLSDEEHMYLLDTGGNLTKLNGATKGCWGEYCHLIKDGLVGVVDTKGNIVVDPQYKDITLNFNEQPGIFIAQNKKGKWGVIDASDNEVLPFEYEYIYPELNGWYLVGKEYSDDTLYGWVDKENNEVIDIQFANALPFGYGKLAAVMDNQKELCGYINKKGEYVIDPKFENGNGFNVYGQAPVYNANKEKWGIINEKGEYVVKAAFEDIKYIAGGLYAVEKEDDEGWEDYIINVKGEKVADGEFVSCESGDIGTVFQSTLKSKIPMSPVFEGVGKAKEEKIEFRYEGKPVSLTVNHYNKDGFLESSQMAYLSDETNSYSNIYHVERYVYDENGKLKSSTKKDNGWEYTYTYNYKKVDGESIVEVTETDTYGHASTIIWKDEETTRRIFRDEPLMSGQAEVQEYDSHGRLLSKNSPFDMGPETYTYDECGNLLMHRFTAPHGYGECYESKIILEKDNKGNWLKRATIRSLEGPVGDDVTEDDMSEIEAREITYY